MSLYESQVSTGRIDPHSFDELGEDYVFGKLLENKSISTAVPTLSKENLGQIASGSLCAYRGIIRNIFDVEFYRGIALDSRNNPILAKYRDFLPQEFSDAQNYDNESLSSMMSSRYSWNSWFVLPVKCFVVGNLFFVHPYLGNLIGQNLSPKPQIARMQIHSFRLSPVRLTE
jgi:hypothetical protein